MLFTGSSIKMECDEDGNFWMDVDCEGDEIRIEVLDPEALYDAVKAGILPWLMEREEARRTRPVAYIDASGAYDLTDPKHPDHHSVMADLWDSREGK